MEGKKSSCISRVPLSITDERRDYGKIQDALQDKSFFLSPLVFLVVLEVKEVMQTHQKHKEAIDTKNLKMFGTLKI